LVDDPCSPFADPGASTLAGPRHHAAHRVIGRIRHHVHHANIGAPVRHMANACGKPGVVPGQPGSLPALPAGRLATLAALPKVAALGAAALVGAAALAATTGLTSPGAARLPASALSAPSPGTGAQPPGQFTRAAVPGAKVPSTPTAPKSEIPVPEPPSLAMLVVAIGTMLGLRRLPRRAVPGPTARPEPIDRLPA
jgi:hypothetical protein